MANSRIGGKSSACKKVLLSMALTAAGAAWAFDAEYTAAQSVTISASGSYLVTGTGGGAITIAANVSGVELTISNVTWTGNNTQINIGNGAALSLVLEGTSTINHTGNSSGPGIKLPQTSSLTVSGTGTLDMKVRNFWPCIGVGLCALVCPIAKLSIVLLCHLSPFHDKRRHQDYLLPCLKFGE